RFKCDWSSDVCSSDLGSIGGAAAAVIGRALDGVSAGLQAGRIKLHVRAAASDLPAGGRVAISQRIVVRVAAIAGDSSVFTRENRAALDREAGRWRMVGLLFHLDVGAAGSR